MESFTNFEKAPDLTKRGYRLDRMKLLLNCFENPHETFKVIHIAGSKGKGSTASFAAAILREASLKTGVYSSPHISDYRERITINGEFATDAVYIRNMNLIKELIEDDQYISLPGGSEPTTFELLTLLAFLIFRSMQCQWVVVETGLGGRLDATNLVRPEIVLLTPIELEHTDLLGETIGEIASEKAGIIKEHIPVISSFQPGEALEVFLKTSASRNAPFSYLPDLYKAMKTELNFKGSRFSILWNDSQKNMADLQLRGDFQGDNCSLAIAGVRRVLPQIKEETINRGISKAFLPGRMEILGTSPSFMIDGAHTKSSAERLLFAYKKMFPQEGILIFGSVSGKDARAMADILADQFKFVIISRPGTFKKSEPGKLYELFKERNENTLLIEDPQSAEKKARELSGGILPVLITGSFYMAAEIRNILKIKENIW